MSIVSFASECIAGEIDTDAEIYADQFLGVFDL